MNYVCKNKERIEKLTKNFIFVFSKKLIVQVITKWDKIYIYIYIEYVTLVLDETTCQWSPKFNN